MDDRRPTTPVQVKLAALCRLCRRDLEVRVDVPSTNGRVYVSLVCPVHGALKKGERYLTGYTAVDGAPEPGADR